MSEQPEIRLAEKSDCPGILNIYSGYVLNTGITFEYEVPSIEEMENRMENILQKYPYLVCSINQEIAGYAYATEFRYRSAYQWSPESTIYLSDKYHGKGIGKLIYSTLFNILRAQGYFNVFAGVVIPNFGSERLHSSCGFQEIGIYRNIGYKNGVWHNTKWYQLVLNEPIADPPKPTVIKDIFLTTVYDDIMKDSNKQLLENISK